VILDGLVCLEAQRPFRRALSGLRGLLAHPRSRLRLLPTRSVPVLGGLAATPPVFHAIEVRLSLMADQIVRTWIGRNPITARAWPKIF